jgi:hypothetical protein
MFVTREFFRFLEEASLGEMIVKREMFKDLAGELTKGCPAYHEAKTCANKLQEAIEVRKEILRNRDAANGRFKQA